MSERGFVSVDRGVFDHPMIARASRIAALRAAADHLDSRRVHIGVALDVTNVKDFGMVELWDDRAVSVGLNTGMRLDGRSE